MKRIWVVLSSRCGRCSGERVFRPTRPIASQSRTAPANKCTQPNPIEDQSKYTIVSVWFSWPLWISPSNVAPFRAFDAPLANKWWIGCTIPTSFDWRRRHYSKCAVTRLFAPSSVLAGQIARLRVLLHSRCRPRSICVSSSKGDWIYCTRQTGEHTDNLYEYIEWWYHLESKTHNTTAMIDTHRIWLSLIICCFSLLTLFDVCTHTGRRSEQNWFTILTFELAYIDILRYFLDRMRWHGRRQRHNSIHCSLLFRPIEWPVISISYIYPISSICFLNAWRTLNAFDATPKETVVCSTHHCISINLCIDRERSFHYIQIKTQKLITVTCERVPLHTTQNDIWPTPVLGHTFWFCIGTSSRCALLWLLLLRLCILRIHHAYVNKNAVQLCKLIVCWPRTYVHKCIYDFGPRLTNSAGDQRCCSLRIELSRSLMIA